MHLSVEIKGSVGLQASPKGVASLLDTNNRRFLAYDLEWIQDDEDEEEGDECEDEGERTEEGEK